MMYYAVIRGKNPGVYTSNKEATKQILGYSGSLLKSFTTLEDAEEYLKNNALNYQPIVADAEQNEEVKQTKKVSSNYYAVANGRQTGIYTKLELAKQQVFKFPNAKW